MRDDFRKEEAMQVQDILRGKPTSQLKYAKPTNTVEEVACRLRIENVGAVPILDDRGDIVGMIAERDVVRAIADFGSRALSMPCTEVVSRDIETCNLDDTMGRVARLMTDRRVRHLLVKADGKITGIVSIGDVVKHRLAELELETNVLRDMAVVRTH
jgi:CBS domain-containing protein